MHGNGGIKISLDDLTQPWRKLPVWITSVVDHQPWMNVNLHEHTSAALQIVPRSCPESISNFSQVNLYTDGSADNSGGWPVICTTSAWAVVVLESNIQGINLVGTAAAKVPIKGQEGWLGATRHSNNVAEYHAVAAALTWAEGLLTAEQAPVGLMINIWSDSQLVIDTITGVKRAHQHHELVHHTRQLLERCRSRTGVSLYHCRGHPGDPWNEMADTLAKHANKNDILATGWPALPEASNRDLQQDVFDLGAWAGDHQMPPVKDGKILPTAATSLPTEQCHYGHPAPEVQVISEQQPHENLPLKFASANVLSLLDPKKKSRASEARMAGLTVTARSAAIQMQFHRHGIHIAGIQEARTQGPSQRSSEHYTILTSGAEASSLGCELWVANKVCTGSHLGGHIAPDIYLLDYAPRHLLARAIIDKIAICVLVMHAPCDRGDGSPEWWQNIDKMLAKHLGQDQLVILADANAHVWEHPCDAIGDHEPETTNELGLLFTRLLTKRKLFAPNTFEHFGGSERDVKTWQGRGTLSYRIDYVALPIA